ncbi:MAG: hypothetical protein U5R31_07215 [Acidimicrobiia bacterium]|nr:hypothetical protein [Acidimicrobiia bacterium]
MWTFPRVAWARDLLPGAQVVVAPRAAFSGPVSVGGTTVELDGAEGGISHIHGHGNASRWAWLHAALDADALLEVVTAVSTRPGLDRLPPSAFLRFRLDGRDWPSGPFPAARVRTRLGAQRWSLDGGVGRHRVSVWVDQPPDRSVALEYVDPDGETAVCTNTERADVDVLLERRSGGRWIVDRHWELAGTGHAEVGLRGSAAPPVRERRPDGDRDEGRDGGRDREERP